MRNLECFFGRIAFLATGILLASTPSVLSQTRPYIGYVYPAGGQQGTTFQIKLGGQSLDDVNEVMVTGSGVAAKVIEYDRPLGNQETTLLREQLKELKRSATNTVSTMMASGPPMMAAENSMMGAGTVMEKPSAPTGTNEAMQKLIARIEKRIAECVDRPASVALASIVYAEVTLAPDASPGPRELRLGTMRGISNPLVFHVGQLPEVCRKPMVTASLEILGKEELALRKRPANEVEQRITIPCTANGQIASGELNRYRFTARRGQRLVITTQGRQLIPYIADAVPGWFQPVLALYDEKGKEVAYDDDYRFKPDPTILFQVPLDGEYVLAIYDAIYRGREDFVYRITIGELPFVTSLFPLGGRVGAAVPIQIQGWNLGASEMPPLGSDAGPGTYSLTARHERFLSNPMLYALDTLPEVFEKEPNNTQAQAQEVALPIIINGRIDRPGDWDVFQFTGRSNDTVVAEVSARRLDSPLDSILKLADATGKLLALNDDCEDLTDGLNTHHADSRMMARLPADGTYYVYLGDTARNGGTEYGYRIRISAPQPDFALRVVPSSVSLRGKGSATLSVYAIRKDGFTGPIKLELKDPPRGFSATPISMSVTQAVARLTIKTSLTNHELVNLTVVGSTRIQDRDVTHEAVPAEDRMQAFLWRHLVPTTELKALVFDPAYQPPPKRTPRARPPVEVQPMPEVALTNSLASTNLAGTTNSVANKPRFTKQQVAGRLRQLKLLFEEGLLTDDFYDAGVAECEAVR
jgi:hypothetical protein